MNDKKQGRGIYKWGKGNIFEGSFQNDFRHGEGKLMLADGEVIEGTWINGVLS